MGKPLAESRGEVAYGAEFLRWFSEETPRIYGRYSVAPDGANRILVSKRPVGPCLLITPWNFPLAMATRKVAPALAAGCTVVVKPAALTPLTTLLFAKVMQEVGVPDGVINVIPTAHSGATTAPLFADPRLRKLSFTGSTEVGQALLRQAASNVLRTSMELGGNAPFLVFADADLDAAVEGAFAAKLRNGGQACTAANRIYVESPIAEEFRGQAVGQGRRRQGRTGCRGPGSDSARSSTATRSAGSEAWSARRRNSADGCWSAAIGWTGLATSSSRRWLVDVLASGSGAHRGDLRPGGADRHLRLRGRRRGRGQQHSVRVDLLPLHHGPVPSAAAVRSGSRPACSR